MYRPTISHPAGFCMFWEHPGFPFPLPVLEELWLPMILADDEWNKLVSAVVSRDEAGCRGLTRLYGDWARGPRPSDMTALVMEDLEEFVRMFGRLIRTLGKTLEELGGGHVSDFDPITMAVWTCHCRNLTSRMQALRKIKLIDAEDFASWARAMEEAGPDFFAPNLDRLIFLDTQLHGEAIACLSRKFARADWQMLQRFQVMYGELDDEGMVLMAGALQSSPHLFPNLSNLMLHGNNIREEGMKALVKALQQGACPRLESLNLDRNSVGNEGLVAFVGAMQTGAPCNATLEVLSLQGCDISWAGAQVYFEAWDEGWMPGIWVHLLTSNPLGVEGLRALCNMFLNGRLTRDHYLYVDHCGDHGFGKLLNSLRYDPTSNSPPPRRGGPRYEAFLRGLLDLVGNIEESRIDVPDLDGAGEAEGE